MGVNPFARHCINAYIALTDVLHVKLVHMQNVQADKLIFVYLNVINMQIMHGRV